MNSFLSHNTPRRGAPRGAQHPPGVIGTITQDSRGGLKIIPLGTFGCSRTVKYDTNVPHLATTTKGVKPPISTSDRNTINSPERWTGGGSMGCDGLVALLRRVVGVFTGGREGWKWWVWM